MLKDLGQLRLGETDAHEPALVCTGCVKDQADVEATFSRPPVAGAFSAGGKHELVVDAQGSCGVQGHQWGCLLLVDTAATGHVVTRVHPARSGATQLRAHRIEAGRDLLIGLFAGWQQGGTWTEAFSVDFAGETPEDQRLVELFVTEGCGETSIGLSTSSGKIDKVMSADLNHDGALDLIVSGTHGEILLKDPLAECKKPRSPVERPFTLRLLRVGELWSADPKSVALLSGRARLRARGVKGQGATGVE